jgi:hypothetical protein
MTAQKAPAKMLVKPLMLKAAEHVASASAATSVAVVTVTLLWRSAVTVGVTGAVTTGAAWRVTVRLRFLARWRRWRSALVGSVGRSGVTLVVGSAGQGVGAPRWARSFPAHAGNSFDRTRKSPMRPVCADR